MKANTIIGLFFIAISIILLYLSVSGRLGDGWLDRADKVASVTSLIVAIIAFINPFSNNASLDSQRVDVGNDNRQINIGQAKNGSVTIGDTTTSAEQRAQAALDQVRSELLDNFSDLATLIQAIKSSAPLEFWDKRRANESELAYQDRAANEFRDYINYIDSQIAITKFSTNRYDSFRRELSYSSEKAEGVSGTYSQQNEVVDSFNRFSKGLGHILSLNLSDVERTERAKSLHQEFIANSKVAFSHAAAHFCIFAETEDVTILSDSFSLIGIEPKLEVGKEGYRAAMNLASRFSKDKAEILRNRLAKQEDSNRREVSRRIEDPYLLRLREMAGLPLTLTEGEISSLQKKEVYSDDKEPVELFELAALSYIEMDGSAASSYFQAALETGQLSHTQSQFAESSIHRIDNPDFYKGSIGVMIIALSPGSSFDKAGLSVGDIIVSLDREVVNEPLDIASALAKSSNSLILLEVIRNKEKRIISVNGGESAGAAVTQLIVLNAIQI